MIITKSERLLIRTFELSDQFAMEQVFCDPKVMLYSEGVRTPSAVSEFLKSNLAENIGESGIAQWAVTDIENDDVMGFCGLFEFSDINGRDEIELGYRFATRFWGQGYATEAAGVVTQHALSAMRSIDRLVAFIDPGNTASIRVVEKLGYNYEFDLMRPGYDYPDYVYVLEQPTTGERKTL